MSEAISTKPYLLRAIHEWCVDNGYTPHMLVEVNEQVRVPMAYVKDKQIVLNLSYTATKDLHFDNQQITFSARFGGVPQNLYIPVNAVKGIFARENGQGMFFELEQNENTDIDHSRSENKQNFRQKKPETNSEISKSKKPELKIVK